MAEDCVSVSGERTSEGQKRTGQDCLGGEATVSLVRVMRCLTAWSLFKVKFEQPLSLASSFSPDYMVFQIS